MSDWRTSLLAIAVVCIFALAGFGVWGLLRPGAKLKPALMIVAALVLLFNLWLYLLPPPHG